MFVGVLSSFSGPLPFFYRCWGVEHRYGARGGLERGKLTLIFWFVCACEGEKGPEAPTSCWHDGRRGPFGWLWRRRDLLSSLSFSFFSFLPFLFFFHPFFCMTEREERLKGVSLLCQDDRRGFPPVVYNRTFLRCCTTGGGPSSLLCYRRELPPVCCYWSDLLPVLRNWRERSRPLFLFFFFLICVQ